MNDPHEAFPATPAQLSKLSSEGKSLDPLRCRSCGGYYMMLCAADDGHNYCYNCFDAKRWQPRANSDPAGVRFYCGITGETQWNHHPVGCGEYACVAPVYGRKAGQKRLARVSVPAGTNVLQDSGAFSDAGGERLSFAAALERQIQHAERYKYTDQIEYRVAYDWLIDEVWAQGERQKKRWTWMDAETAVSTTVAAAKYLSDNRHGLNLILPAQGVDAQQYAACAERVIEYLDPERDALGLGGWCILGIFRGWLGVYADTLRRVLPMAAQRGVKRVHIFGVIFPKALGWLLHEASQYGIAVSTDSMSPSLAPTRGQWGYGNWRDNTYQRPEPDVRGLERARHVALTRACLANLSHTHYYRPAPRHETQWQLSFGW